MLRDRDDISKINEEGRLKEKERSSIDNLFVSNEKVNSLPKSKVHTEYVEKESKISINKDTVEIKCKINDINVNMKYSSIHIAANVYCF